MENEVIFEWDGSSVLLDANTKKNLVANSLGVEKRTLKIADSKLINSGLASSLYRSPLESFQKITTLVEKMSGLTRLERLVIRDFKNLSDVISLIEVLKNEGVSLSAAPVLSTFNSKEAIVLVFYQGEEKTFTDLLSRLKELKSSYNYKFVTELIGTDHVMKFVSE
jgi:hypothetical protein